MDNPIEKFITDWNQARSQGDQNAAYCCLATVTKAGQAAVRVLVLREVTDEAFIIFINDASPKWQQLNYVENYELLVFWPSLLCQYRLRGSFSEIPSSQMHQNWQKKPYISKIMDHYYLEFQSQSSIINDETIFLENIKQLKRKYPHKDTVPFPGNAIGVSLKPTSIEQWYGSVDAGLHQRNLYTLDKGQWYQQRVVP